MLKYNEYYTIHLLMDDRLFDAILLNPDLAIKFNKIRTFQSDYQKYKILSYF